ncbi:DUF4405 domain-containing protein [Deltaproteobacteria bacterium OttesenSCG-928-K17]|nr:DUF4405 domain-containing protein [Deltaproteobacteria bacterium OttesenSCG-928-K17]
MTRKFISQTVFFAFIILAASSFVLYLMPGAKGQDAWSFMGLGLGQWKDVHLTSGFLFLAFGLWHITKNWRVLTGGFKKIASAGWQTALPILAALALNIFIVAGTLAHVPPMEQVLSFFQQTKTEFRQNSQAGQGHGRKSGQLPDKYVPSENGAPTIGLESANR